MLNFAVIGFGYWGPNIVRNLAGIKDARVKMICDRDPLALQRAKSLYPHIECTSHIDDVFKSNQIDIVAIITPVSTHFEIAKKALEYGKYIFVEKPFTATSQQAQTLISSARKKNLIIMVDHTFLFTGAVRKIKELMVKKTLGDLHYYDSTRVSLGLFQHDVNVIWDLAPHDFSILDYIVNEKPTALTAQGMDHFGAGQENIAYITLYFKSRFIAHINVNWLSPVKVRTTLIAGQKRMLVWDDLETDEKIKLYDKGVKVQNKESLYQMLIDYRSGDMWSPRVKYGEALSVELNYLVHCIKKNKIPLNDGESGLRVVQLLEASDKSLKNKGKLIKL